MKTNKEILIARYFIPSCLKHITITKTDEEKFIEWASQGKHRKDVKQSHFEDGFNTLVSGKKRAGIHVGVWEEGVMDGSVPYHSLLGGEDPSEILPDYVVKFMAKEMFKGVDKDIILKKDAEVRAYWTWYRRLWLYVLKLLKTRQLA